MNEQPNTSPMNTPIEPKKASSIGPIVGILIIVIILLVGGLYFWGEQRDKESAMEAARQEAAQIENAPDSKVDRLNAQGSSDSASSIESDLSATDLNNLDEGTAAAEGEFQLQ